MLSVLLFGGVDWTWTAGHSYWEGWVGFITLLVPTFIANITTFVLVTYSPRLNRSSSSIMVRYLSLEDAAFSLCCLVQCALNLSEMQIVGDRAGCEVQAIYALFFMLSTGYTLCCIAYNSERRISFKPGLTRRQVFILHCGIWLWSALIAVLSSYILAPARVMPSAVYCLVSLVSLQAGLVFYAPVLLIGVFLSHRYFLIYRHITREANELVTAYAQQTRQAQTRQINVAKRMFCIVLAYFLCALPVLLLAVYECIINADAPPAAYLVAGHLVHLNSLLNPILYVWMSTQTRAALWEMLRWARDAVHSRLRKDGALAADKTLAEPEPKRGENAAADGGKQFGTPRLKRCEQLEAELSYGVSTRVTPLSPLPTLSQPEGTSSDTNSARLISLGFSDGTAVSGRLSPMQDGSLLLQLPRSPSPVGSHSGDPSANGLQPSVSLPFRSRVGSSARATQALRAAAAEAELQLPLVTGSAEQQQQSALDSPVAPEEEAAAAAAADVPAAAAAQGDRLLLLGVPEAC